MRIKLEQMDGDGLQLKNRMHIAREIESSYNDSRKQYLKLLAESVGGTDGERTGRSSEARNSRKMNENG